MKTLIRTALDAADAAARVHAEYAGQVGVDVAEEKGYSDFVTMVDLEAQRAALSVIRDRHPGHRVLAEEEDEREGGESAPVVMNGPPLWIVDPLDGTTNFLHGHPFYAASVGAVVDGEFAAGAVVQAPTGERWWGARGEGAWRGGERIRVSQVADLSRALVGTGFPFKALELLPRYLDQFGRILSSSSGIRRTGAAALDLCYLADGRLDVFWELILNPWDIAAGIAILREAGGVITRPDGSPADLLTGPIVAGNSQGLWQTLRDIVEREDPQEN